MNPDDSKPSCRDPFDDALNAVLNGEADAKDVAILNDTLRVDPQARRAYIRAMAFEGMLASEFAPMEAELPAPKPRRWKFPLSIAATAILAAGLAWMWFPNRDNGVTDRDDGDDQDVTHAVISLLDEARGRFGGGPLSAGQRLSDGLLDLESGLAEITFDNGAEVTLEGPAKFLLESGNRSRLDIGNASAVVPEQARGFVIHTPTSYIRDLGNAVSVEVRDDQQTDLHVLEGEVEVVPTGMQARKAPRVVRQMESVRLSGRDVKAIQFKPDRKSISKPKAPPPVPASVHWSFDSWSGPSAMDDSRSHGFRLIRDRKPVPPGLTDGPFGRALRLSGDGVFGRSDFAPSPPNKPRTLACWVRLPINAASSEAILAWGAGPKWQVTWNRQAAHGNMGAPKIEFGEGYLTGSSDLRDGDWHHLAIVLLGGPKSGVASHARIYLDGRLEAPSGRRQQRIKVGNTTSEAQPLTLGRGFVKRGEINESSFEGDLDELHVFEGALLPRQIVRLMKRNSLANPAR
jgi:hypothetical protein